MVQPLLVMPLKGPALLLLLKLSSLKKKRKEARVPNKIGAATTRNQGGPYTKW